MRRRLAGAAAFIVFILVDSATAACSPGLEPVQTARLIFGRDIGTTVGVTRSAWRTFLAREVTPRFPGGFTVQDAAGQWRGKDGRLVREPSKLLLIVLSGASGETDKLAAIRSAYKTRFHQDAVLLIEDSACAAF